jgi:hypothetical protein
MVLNNINAVQNLRIDRGCGNFNFEKYDFPSANLYSVIVHTSKLVTRIRDSRESSIHPEVLVTYVICAEHDAEDIC